MVAYGIDLTQTSFAPSAKQYFVANLASETVRHDAEKYLRIYEADNTNNALLEEYLEYYEDDHSNVGFGVAIANSINDNEHLTGLGHFECFADYLYVCMVMPNDEDEKAEMLTRRQIELLLQKYLPVGDMVSQPLQITDLNACHR